MRYCSDGFPFQIDDCAGTLVKYDFILALLSLLSAISVKAISGVCVASLNIVFMTFEPFGRSISRSPIPIAFSFLPSAVAILQLICL